MNQIHSNHNDYEIHAELWSMVHLVRRFPNKCSVAWVANRWARMGLSRAGRGGAVTRRTISMLATAKAMREGAAR